MKTPFESSGTFAVASLLTACLFVGACSGAPPATPAAGGATPAGSVAGAPSDPRATPPGTTGAPSEPDAPSLPPEPGSSPRAVGVDPAPDDARATIELGGQTYLVEARAVPDPATPICSLDGLVVVALLSADRRTLLSIAASFDGQGLDGASFSVRFHDDQRVTEYWAPIEPVPFSVTGSTATWNGTMEERLGTGQESQVAITIECGG